MHKIELIRDDGKLRNCTLNILFDNSDMYDSNGLKVVFNVYKKCDDLSKIKVEITETTF